MSIKTQSLDTRIFLQTFLEICERLFQESPLNSAPFTILDIEKLAERAKEDLKEYSGTRIITGPFTVFVSKCPYDYQIRLEIPKFVPRGLVHRRLSELRENIYKEFERQGISYSQ